MTIYLIRHGKTVANERRLYCGSTDLSLSDAGRTELRKLHYCVGDACFVTSGMRRTDETLELLFGAVPHVVESRFREVDFGRFEMHSYNELKDRDDYQQWLCGDNEQNIPPDGESGAQMTVRVLDAFAALRGDTVVVTHGGVIAAIMAHLFPLEGKSRYDWQPPAGHGYRLTQSSSAAPFSYAPLNSMSEPSSPR